MDGNNSEGGVKPMWVLIGLLVVLILSCCASLIVTYNRTGNINIFSQATSGSTSEDAAWLRGFSFGSGTPESSDGGGLGLLDAFGVKQNCQVGEWGAWSPCSSKCGSQATKTRTRSKTKEEKNGGKCLLPLTDTQTCTDLPSCETAPITGEYEPCPNGSTLDAGACRIHGSPISESECNNLRNQAAGQGAALGVAGGGIGAGIGAGIAAGDVDCDAMYTCPTGFRDTRVNKMCEADAVHKCPTGYEWNDGRKLCTFKNP